MLSLVGLVGRSVPPDVFSSSNTSLSPCSSCALSVAKRSFKLGFVYESPSGPSAIDESFPPSTEVIELSVSLLSLVSARDGTGERAFRMLPILPKRAPKPFDALRARLPGTGGGDILPEDCFRGDVAADSVESKKVSLTGDCLPEEATSLMLGWLTFTGNLGDTLLCLPCAGFCGALMELRCVGRDLLGEDSFVGNAPGASVSLGLGFTAVGVGGSTSISAAGTSAASLCVSAIAVGCVSCESTVSFVSLPVSCGELAPWIPRPAGSVSCAGSVFSFSSAVARGVSMASSKASLRCVKRLAVFAHEVHTPVFQRRQHHLPTSRPGSHLRRRRHAAS